MKILTGMYAGREVELVGALDRVVTVRLTGTQFETIVPAAPTDLDMTPEEWGVLSNLGGTENLTRWYGYDIGFGRVVEVVPDGA
jgi:hypothetical protein